EGTYGYVRGNTQNTSYDDAKSYRVRSELVQFTVAPDASSTPQYYLPSTGGLYTTGNLRKRDWIVRNQLVYNYASADLRHQLTLLGGQEAQEQLVNVSSATVRGYNEALQTYGAVDYVVLNNGVMGTVMPMFGPMS